MEMYELLQQNDEQGALIEQFREVQEQIINQNKVLERKVQISKEDLSDALVKV